MPLINSDKTTIKIMSSMYSDNLDTPFPLVIKKKGLTASVVRTTPYFHDNTNVREMQYKMNK